MKILHVTESLGGGVFESLVQLAGAQSAAGHTVYLLHSRRPDTPSEEELLRRFRPLAAVRSVGGGPMPSVLVKLRNATVQLASGIDLDVIHLHSSFAGLLRSTLSANLAQRVVYTPHGYAFARDDLSVTVRALTFATEACLQRRSATIAVGPGEADLSRRYLRAKRVSVLRNRIDTETVPLRMPANRPLVVCVARLRELKAPERFAAVARELSGEADFVWIGDGDPVLKARYFRDSPVQVTGWLPRREALQRMAKAHVLLSCSRAEGLPLSIIEAQAIGIPAVLSDIPGHRDAIVDGVTGYLAKNHDEAVRRCRELIRDGATALRLGIEGRQRVQRYHDAATLAEDSVSTYESLTMGAVTS